MALRPIMGGRSAAAPGALAPIVGGVGAGAGAMELGAMAALFQQQLLRQQQELLVRQQPAATTGRRAARGAPKAASSHGGRKSHANEISASRWSLMGEISPAAQKHVIQ